jgi:DNA processing protein
LFQPHHRRISGSFNPVRLSDERRIDWLRLIRTENVGPRTFRLLINQFGGAKRAIERLPELARRGGRALNVVSRDEAAREISAAAKLGVKYIGLGEIEYPALLRETEDAPPLLAVRGNLEALAKPAVALVGSRNASLAGTRLAAKLARELGEAGFTVVSGLARGIDSAAHRASLLTGTVAALAGGHDKPYPPEHVSLIEDMLAHGAAVSEMPLGWEPRARDFPRRNRIIAGIALGVVVVEAAERSGSLITARMALEANREVFAVPGSPADPRAGGTNQLLRRGATLVTSAADVIEVLAPMIGRNVTPPEMQETETAIASDANAAPSDDELRASLQNLLGAAPVSIDDLSRETKAPAGSIQIALLELELAGRIERHGGGLVSLITG